MITYQCDGCGKEMPKHALRYTVKIEVAAAYDKLVVGLVDLVRSHRAELLELIERLKNKDPKELEEGVYKQILLDLCPSCQRLFIRHPLRFQPEQAASEPTVDVDGFLRSLGFGGRSNEERE